MVQAHVSHSRTVQRICITYEHATLYAHSVWRTETQFFVYNIDSVESFLGIVIGCIVAFSLILSTVWHLIPFYGESHRSQWVKSELRVMVGELSDLGEAVFCAPPPRFYWSTRSVIVKATVKQYIRSFINVSLTTRENGCQRMRRKPLCDWSTCAAISRES